MIEPCRAAKNSTEVLQKVLQKGNSFFSIIRGRGAALRLPMRATARVRPYRLDALSDPQMLFDLDFLSDLQDGIFIQSVQRQ
jgi:hypothetical protein